MKWLLYNALFAVAYLVMVPSFLLRMKRRGGYRARFSDRFGRYPKDVLSALCLVPGAEGSEAEAPQAQSTKHQALSTNRIWIHAVSVGEVQVAGQLMRAMRERNPNVRFVFSTTSSTGWKTAEREVTPADVLIYNPLDFGGCVKRALNAVNPRAVILTETEIWPNFIRAARTGCAPYRRGVPIYLVNARISDRSAPRYKALRWFFGEVFRCFTKIYAQSDLDAKRLTDAGADPASVQVTGSFKFDVAHRNEAKERELRAWIGEGEILLGGSTWPGEDVVMLETYRKVLARHPGVKLVIAPRHFEKADAVEANIRAAGFGCVRRSRGGRAAARPSPEVGARPSPDEVFLADTTGELMGLFGIATVAFVGKSLCEHGSQNMIEPCLCGVATVVGPFTENFRPVMSDLLAADALVQTPDASTPEARAASVETELLRFFDEPERRAAYGQRAQAAVARRCGVVGRCADELLEALA